MRAIYLTVFFLFCSLEGKEVADIMQSMPSKDKERIEFFFSYLVQRDNLGFVLFGHTKAAAFCSIPIVCDYALVPESITETPLKYQKNLKQSWAVWNRYKDKFKHPNIIICEEHDCFKKSAFLQLFFIDKRKLGPLLDEHREDFEKVLGKNFLATDFMDRLEKKRKLRPLIKHDEKLLGLILGFGKESSSGFKKMQKGEKDPLFTRVGHRPKGCCIVPVSFRGNPDSTEVKALVDTYTKEILEIEDIFKRDSFLSDTLEKFCSS